MTAVSILTISDTRNLQTDQSGQLIETAFSKIGATVSQRVVVIDDIVEIQSQFLAFEKTPVEMIVTNGGTGVAIRDVTIAAIRPLLIEEIPGFGEEFRRRSISEVGSHALASRALAGFNVRNQLCYCLPGSTGACQTALDQLILPEFHHLLFERQK